MDLAGSMATAVTAAGMHHQLTYREAADAVTQAALEQRESGTTAGGVVVPVADVLAVLPHETVKPIARWYQLIKKGCGVAGPYYHAFMHYAEIPLVVARRVTVPLMHTGSYRRRLIIVTAPFSCAFFILILTTHILKGMSTSAGGCPYWVMAFLCGLVYSAALHYWLLPVKGGHGGGCSCGSRRAGEYASLLATTGGSTGDGVGQSLLGDTQSSAKSEEHAPVASGTDSHGHGKRPWYKKIGLYVAGPNDHPVPSGVMMWILLMTSFIMSLFWLLVIATEIVGVAICFGKILHIPDVVMGLTVLAVGCVNELISSMLQCRGDAPRVTLLCLRRLCRNSINDLSASITIAKEGYPSMAIAGAYAGPMFNVLAGEAVRPD
jgi:hypothetical protein